MEHTTSVQICIEESASLSAMLTRRTAVPASVGGWLDGDLAGGCRPTHKLQGQVGIACGSEMWCLAVYTF